MKKKAGFSLLRKESKRKRQRDDRGFTLLELIITMAIFAVIAIPIMNMFGRSAQLNGKARTVQNTNDAASSIAEVIKSADLAKDFWLKGKNDSKTFNTTEARDLASKFKADGTIDTPTINSDGKLSFQLRGVPSGGRKFDAAITIDPEASDYFEKRNKESITTAQDVTQYYAESSKTGTTPFDIAVSKLGIKEKNGTVLSHSRKIDIAFDLKTNGSNQVVTAKVYYKYHIKYSYATEIDGVIETHTSEGDYGESNPVYESTIKTYDNNDGKDHSINFFLFYNPDYTGNGYPKDHITIKNEKQLTGGVYVIKQKLDGLTHSLENGYSAWIDLKEKHGKNDAMNLTVGTNINLSHVDGANYGKKLSGNFLVRNTISDSVVRTMEPEGDYIKSSDYNRVYAYDVKVYEPAGELHADTEKPIYQISGVRLR